MKKLILLLLFIPLVSIGQIVDQQVSRIANKNVEIFLTDEFNSNNSFLVSVDLGTRKVEDKSQGIGNQLSKSLTLMGYKVVSDGNANVIKMSIKWAALDELKRISATIFDSYSKKVVGSIEYNGPYMPNSHKNIAAAIAYKIVSEADKRKGNVINYEQADTIKQSSQTQNEKDKAIDELKKLKELLDLGLITQEEFNKKSELLKKIILEN